MNLLIAALDGVPPPLVSHLGDEGFTAAGDGEGDGVDLGVEGLDGEESWLCMSGPEGQLEYCVWVVPLERVEWLRLG